MGLHRFPKKCAIALLALLLVGCGKADPVPETTQTATETTSAQYLQTELQMIVTYENLGDLENYKNLKLLDATGSTAYPALEVYAAKHPDVDIIYTVDLGKRPEVCLRRCKTQRR